jgi:hypothetical protein
MADKIKLWIPEDKKLPDNAAYTNRFHVKSQSSNSLYVVAQSKSGRWWSCSCPGWIRWKKCKHLAAMALPAYQKPMEIDNGKTA